MNRRKKRRRKRKGTGPAVSGPFARTYWLLRCLADRKGFFLLFDGDPASPRLTFFDCVRGVPLIDYWPRARLWAFAARPSRSGACEGHEDILTVVARAAGAARATAGGRVSRTD